MGQIQWSWDGNDNHEDGKVSVDNFWQFTDLYGFVNNAINEKKLNYLCDTEFFEA